MAPPAANTEMTDPAASSAASSSTHSPGTSPAPQPHREQPTTPPGPTAASSPQSAFGTPDPAATAPIRPEHTHETEAPHATTAMPQLKGKKARRIVESETPSASASVEPEMARLRIAQVLEREESSEHGQPLYVCRVAGSKKTVKRTEGQLRANYPRVLADFHSRSGTPSVAPESQTASTDGPNGEDGGEGDGGRHSSEEERAGSDFEDEEEEEGDEDMDPSGDFSANPEAPTPPRTRGAGGNRRSRGGGKSRKFSPKPARRSTRETRSKKVFDFAGDSEDDVDMLAAEAEDEMAAEEDSDVVVSARGRRASKRATAAAVADESDQDSPGSLATGAKGRAAGRRRSQLSREWTEDERPRDRHRSVCAKCKHGHDPDVVSKWQKQAKGRRPKDPRAGSFFDRFPDLDAVYAEGCWVDCDCCTEASHFGCLHSDIRNEIRKEHRAERQAALAKANKLKEQGEDWEAVEVPEDKKEQNPELRLVVRCGMCRRPNGTKCMLCTEGPKLRKPVRTETAQSERAGSTAGATMTEDPGAVEPAPTSPVSPSEATDPVEPYIFRCQSCHRGAHYSCLEKIREPAAVEDQDPSQDPLDAAAEYWQSDFTCMECYQWEGYSVEFILAWRKKAKEEGAELHGEMAREVQTDKLGSPSRRVEFKLPDAKEPFEEAEYLVKLKDHHFGACLWLPHSYMLAKQSAKLRNFLAKGPLLDLKQFNSGDDEDNDQGRHLGFGLTPDPDAFDKIPKAWLTPDRVLSVQLKEGGKVKEGDTVDELCAKIVTVYIKWQDQPYTAATWTDPIEEDSEFYPAFTEALARWLKFRHFSIPKLSAKELAELDKARAESKFKALTEQPSYIPHKLLDFQLEGVNFCYYNWHRRHATILADEMGLGKTVQICSLISVLHHREGRAPFLIVVPNSTIGNWVRETHKWSPDLKAVPLSGTAEARTIVSNYELFPSERNRETAAHVVLATYEAAEKATGLLNRVQRWEAVIVDEGQRLKSGSKSALFKSLASLRTGNRILMSGTPLNNNLRELFNLLSFIDPEKYPSSGLDELEKRYESLTAELVDELRNTIRPYMLRRTKDTALNLPKLSEIIVPISMRPLQKKVYKDLLKRNTSDITSIFTNKKTGKTRANFMNILMELRKDLGHPFLVMPDLEELDHSVSEEKVHNNFVDASGKLVFLQKFLPKLKEHGHRTLIFSQFAIFLDVMERFFMGEGVRFVRLDGSTSQLDRQTRIDAFNKPHSDVDVFLLSTRAGGAGINLATADTVIIADPDWNPHNDLQAISRAHRYGQTKPVTVFKLMCKGSAEEKIVQVGKRKLVLDHLVIQKASEEEAEAATIENILQFGAPELFAESDEALDRDIRHTDKELDRLLNDAHEMAREDPTANKDSADRTFAFARVWEGDSGLTAIADDQEDNLEEQRGFWDRILQQNNDEEAARRLAAEAETGRGHRKRRAVDYHDPDRLDTPAKKKKKADDDADFMGGLGSEVEEDEDGGSRMEASDLDIGADVERQKKLDKEKRKAERAEMRRLKALRRAERAARLAAEAGAAPAGSHLPGIAIPDVPLMNGSAGGPDHRRHPVGRPLKLTPDDVRGKSGEEKQAIRDRILRDLVYKAKAIRNTALDQILAEVRHLDAKEQTRRLIQATQLVKALTGLYAPEPSILRQPTGSYPTIWQPNPTVC